MKARTDGLQPTVTDDRIRNVRMFYSLLELLRKNVGGERRLERCSGKLDWPKLGVYFFMESGEVRSTSGTGPRIVRVGTHALKPGSATNLWGRLWQHRGQKNTGGGNHRGSVFREIVGAALSAREGYDFPTWGDGNSAARDIRLRELPLEQEVSAIIGKMPVLWLSVNDDPGRASLRGFIERNAIALLSNAGTTAVDPPSQGWLGHWSNRIGVRASGLWNSNHVNDFYDPAFLACMKELIADDAM